MRFFALLTMSACAGGPPTPVPVGPCESVDAPWAELSQGDGWGLDDGEPVAFGIPPQGGAPYAPFVVRLHGMPASVDGYHVEMSAFDPTVGEVVGTGSYDQRFVCANVGENEGTRVASEFHMRFIGWEPVDLAGHEVDVEIAVSSPDAEVTVGYRGPLDWVLGPMPE